MITVGSEGKPFSLTADLVDKVESWKHKLENLKDNMCSLSSTQYHVFLLSTQFGSFSVDEDLSQSKMTKGGYGSNF